MHPQTGGQHSRALERLVLHLSPLSPPPGSHLLCFVTTLELPPPCTPAHSELRGPACQASAGLAQGLRQRQLPRYWGAPRGWGLGRIIKWLDCVGNRERSARGAHDGGDHTASLPVPAYLPPGPRVSVPSSPVGSRLAQLALQILARAPQLSSGALLDP